MAEPAIEVREVSKRHASGRGEVQALRGVSLCVARGEGVFLAGKSGSGKTTLLNCLGALEAPDSGRILVEGADLGALDAGRRALFRSRRVGFLFQAGNLLPWLTVAENLRLPLELAGVPRREQEGRIAELLAAFGLPGHGRARPAELSGGEAQRVACARAMAHRPAILLADEPTASLDSANGRQLMDLLFALCRDGGTTLVVATHDRELLGLAGRVLHLKDGTLATDG